MSTYSNNQHLKDELQLLSWQLQKEFYLRQYDQSEGESSYFFIDPGEVHSIFDELLNINTSQAVEAKMIEEKVCELREKINRNIAQVSNKSHLMLYKLQKIFSLSCTEINILIIALAPELDRRYARIYGYLNDDMGQKYASPHLVFDLLQTQLDFIGQGWELLSPTAKLIHNRLISFAEPTFDTTLIVHERIKRFVLGNNDPAFSIIDFAEFIANNELINPYCESTDIVQRIIHLQKAKRVFCLYGCEIEKQQQIILQTCKQLNLAVIKTDLDDILELQNASKVLDDITLEALLQNAAIVFYHENGLRTKTKFGLFRRFLKKWSFNDTVPIFISSNDVVNNNENLWFTINTYNTYNANSYEIWSRELPKANLNHDDIGKIATMYPLGTERIRDVINCVKQLHPSRKISLENLDYILKNLHGAVAKQYVNKLPCFYSWNDIVIPHETLVHLKEISCHIAHEYQVYHEWDFKSKIPHAQGCNIMFVGTSGTGKTMAAEIMAADIKRDIYKINIAQMISKYIGETEKNLDGIFEAAKDTNAILFFDEADSIFGKRTTVKDAHDRYANISTDYLLQKLEEFKGVVILATNFLNNIDKAFTRRLAFIVEFPFPSESEQKMLWKKMFPQKAPLGDIDYTFLSQKLSLCGGHIKNIALNSAFLAAKENSKIEMRHICHAAKREYTKLGKVFNSEDFRLHL